MRLKHITAIINLSQEAFKSFFSLFPEPVCVVSASDGYFKKLNGAWECLLGYSLDELFEFPFTNLIHPDDVESSRFAITVQKHRAQDYVNRYRCRDNSYKFLSWHISAVEGNDLVIGTARDITGFLRSRDEMQRTQRLESLGVLAGGIAHDFNNLLTVVVGNISLASLRLNGQPDVEECLKSAEDAAFRAKGLTHQLLTFAKGSTPIKKILKVDNLIRESAGFSVHGTAVKCCFVFPDDLWPVEADEGQLSQVIQNLVINAAQAMPNGGEITLGTENVVSQSGDKFVRISVCDSGVGIPDALLHKIFDPYFTTKTMGNGLGLASCHSIVLQHGGKIRVTSVLGVGSNFIISLPAAVGGVEGTLDPNPAAEMGQGRILVMDDDSSIQHLIKSILKEMGYSAECVGCGADVASLYKTRMDNGIPFAAVIMDLTIPGGMGGLEAQAALLKVDPEAVVIVSSGYSTDPVMANFADYGFKGILVKPYTAQELSQILRKVLVAGRLHRR